MKILHVITTMNPLSGGPCQGIRNSDSELRKKKGIQREVVSLDDPTETFLGKDEFPIHAIGAGKGPWRYNPKLLPWLIENLPRFEVIIVNGLWLYSTYAAWKSMDILKKKVNQTGAVIKLPKFFVMPHGMLDPYFQHAPDRKLKALRNYFYWHLIEKKVINDAYGLLFTCEVELHLARKTFSGYHPNRELNVSYGIFAPPNYEVSMSAAFNKIVPQVEQSPFLLSLSRINEKKGTDMLIKAYSKLLFIALKNKQEFPMLVVAGPGLETPFGRKIQRMVSDNGDLKRFIFFPGMLTGDVKWGAFYTCSAFVLPSHQENFGIAVAEALACGKPVLISDQINIWREIEDGGGGIVAKDTVDGVDWMLKKWMTLSTAEKEQMEINAFKTYQKYFAIEPASDRFLDALNS